MKNQIGNTEIIDSSWKGLYKTGGIAALAAGILFRRNIASEIGLFVRNEVPLEAADWFELLQESRIFGFLELRFILHLIQRSPCFP